MAKIPRMTEIFGFGKKPAPAPVAAAPAKTDQTVAPPKKHSYFDVLSPEEAEANQKKMNADRVAHNAAGNADFDRRAALAGSTKKQKDQDWQRSQDTQAGGKDFNYRSNY